MKYPSWFVFLVLVLATPVTVAGGEGPLVIIQSYKFQPQEITINAGQTIRWENREKRQYHSVWFEAQGEEEPDYFFPEESYERKFDKAGTYPYRCGPHPEMTGIVHVK